MPKERAKSKLRLVASVNGIVCIQKLAMPGMEFKSSEDRFLEGILRNYKRRFLEFFGSSDPLSQLYRTSV